MIFAFLKTILEGKFCFSENMPQYNFTLMFFTEIIVGYSSESKRVVELLEV